MSVRVVAEAGQCNMGSVATAIEMAKQANYAGAWGIKFQLLKPETIARADAAKYWTDNFGTATQREAFTKAGLVDYGAWREVKTECDLIGLEFLATPFDLEALDALLVMGCGSIKIASGDITYRQLLDKAGASGARIILSTGASTLAEIRQALEWLGTHEVTLLACTLSYPTPVHAAHLARITTLRTLGFQVGYSDHTSLPETGMCAAALGSVLNEVHYTFDRDAGDVPDHKMAVDPVGLAEYVSASNLGAGLRGADVLSPSSEEFAARTGARRSLVALRHIAVGETITRDDVACLRPGDGIEPKHLDDVVGRTARSAIPSGRPLRWDQLA